MCRFGAIDARQRRRPMLFQGRDAAVLAAIDKYGGVLSRRHLKAMFWPNTTWRAMEMRLSQLYRQGYINWPSPAQRGTRPIPEPICWLGWKGAVWLACERGAEVEQPKSQSDSQLRLLERRLRELGLDWLREPRWSLLRHDLTMVDFRLAVENSVAELPNLRLEAWLLESDFRSRMDVVEYSLTDSAGRSRVVRKGVRPDGFFSILDAERQQGGLPARARFLVEVDMATHDNPSFGREKALPGVAYLKSAAYKGRYGCNAGRWLVVTTGKVRLKNLMAQTRQAAGAYAGLFLFATLDEILNCNLITSPAWWQAGSKDKVALLRG